MGAHAGLAVRAAAAAALVSAGLAGCAAATSGQAAGPSKGPPVTVYVIVDSAVVAIRAATGVPGPKIPAGTVPVAVAVTPDGKTAYVPASTSRGYEMVTPIDTAVNTAGKPIRIGTSDTGGCDADVIAITPDGKTAYVTNYSDGTVIPISTAANTAGPPIKTGKNPSYIAITPDGKTAYVSNRGSGTVTPIDTAANTPGTPIPVGGSPGRIAIAP
jgi:YVTN family beta-propeller protein